MHDHFYTPEHFFSRKPTFIHRIAAINYSNVMFNEITQIQIESSLIDMQVDIVLIGWAEGHRYIYDCIKLALFYGLRKYVCIAIKFVD